VQRRCLVDHPDVTIDMQQRLSPEIGMANSAARSHLTILYSPLATLRERVLAESRRSDHRCRHALPNRSA